MNLKRTKEQVEVEHYNVNMLASVDTTALPISAENFQKNELLSSLTQDQNEMFVFVDNESSNVYKDLFDENYVTKIILDNISATEDIDVEELNKPIDDETEIVNNIENTSFSDGEIVDMPVFQVGSPWELIEAMENSKSEKEVVPKLYAEEVKKNTLDFDTMAWREHVNEDDDDDIPFFNKNGIFENTESLTIEEKNSIINSNLENNIEKSTPNYKESVNFLDLSIDGEHLSLLSADNKVDEISSSKNNLNNQIDELEQFFQTSVQISSNSIL
ncbi:hypothetical protein HK099_003839 [Clydaea vesicula]|uniref:Uncharacterized protein n=1 Tax=Clydaea vesicula TaxID=447962 RepID=A0AAD5U1A5_9FUNG|nr:hypothetical protein HK099_003839 [Clydaea vesicula]